MMTFTQICMLMTGQRIMPPGLRAAAFEALAKIPRVRLDHDEVDVLGRHGIGVSYPEVAFTFVFDSRTYDCLGLRTKGSGAQRGSWPVASGRLVLRDEEPGEGGCGGRHRPAPLNPVTGLASDGGPGPGDPGPGLGEAGYPFAARRHASYPRLMDKPLVAVLSGAGISTDSGIPDYRGPNGLWRRDPEAEKLVTYEYYMSDPEIRRRSWQMRRRNRTLKAEPNAAHRAVAELERSGTPVRVITQNVDGLHQLAGMPARKVLELHGTARSVVCTNCHARGPMEDAIARVEAGEDDPLCLECGGILKSATVMFGERLDPVVLGDAVAITKACQIFIAVGTSLQVQPAAALAGVAADNGARLIIVNAEPTPYDDRADEVIREPIGTALPKLLRGLGEPTV